MLFGSKMSSYALDNSWIRARRRLSLLEQQLDPMTKRRLIALGIQNGSGCLEVGARGGSVAVWLCDQVEPTGRVVATDISLELLQGVNRPNFEAIKHDIVVDSPLEGGFDFVHARWLLHDLREPELAIRRMIDALRPGGWSLLEELDFFPVHTSTSLTFSSRRIFGPLAPGPWPCGVNARANLNLQVIFTDSPLALCLRYCA